MAKNTADSNEPELNGTEETSEANPYINDDAKASSRFGWIKSKPAKITAIAVGGALALGAAFAGGAVVGKVTTFNDGPSIGAPFGSDGEHPEFDGGRKFDGDQADGGFGKRGPRPPHDFDGDAPQGSDLEGQVPETPADPEVQSN